MVYFIQDIGGGPVKIGHSIDVDGRFRQLESHYNRSLVLLATMDGDRDAERAIHKRFAHLRIGRKEQFRPGPDLMSFIGRPLLACPNPATVEAMPAAAQVAIIHLKGSQGYAAWLDAVHNTTHIPKATIIRLAVMEWAKKHGHPEPPEI